MHVEPHARAIRAYFEAVYPHRASPGSGKQFRIGESDRIAAVRELLENRPRTEILDVGCGDGVFLESVLSVETSRVRVEDIVPARVWEAAGRLRQPDRIVEAAVADINAPASSDATFDVVLAIGVLDYNPHWQQILPRLLQRARATLIVDFPNAACGYAEKRRAWLRSYGLDCRYTTLAELHSLVEPYADKVLIKALPQNWIVRFSVADAPSP